MKKIIFLSFITIAFIFYVALVMPMYGNPIYIASMDGEVEDASLYKNGQNAGFGSHAPRVIIPKDKMKNLAATVGCAGIPSSIFPLSFYPSLNQKPRGDSWGVLALVQEKDTLFLTISSDNRSVFFLSYGIYMESTSEDTLKEARLLIKKCSLWDRPEVGKMIEKSNK